MKCKKIIILTLTLLTLITGYAVYGQFDNTEPFYDVSRMTDPDEDTLDIANTIQIGELESSDSTFSQIRNFFGLGQYSQEERPALAYIQIIINRLLGLVSFVSLIMVIFAFYLIFFSKQEEGVGKAKKMLMGVAIALAVMGLSRLIVSYFFNLYSITT